MPKLQFLLSPKIQYVQLVRPFGITNNFLLLSGFRETCSQQFSFRFSQVENPHPAIQRNFPQNPIFTTTLKS